MMNMPGVEEALHKASQECPHLGLGVHLVLTTGIPLLPTSQLPSLIAGRDSFPDEMDLIQRIPLIDLKEVRAEWHAQVERFVLVTGHVPDHLDSHHHISFLSPGLFQVMLELSQEFQCAIRFPTGEAATDMVSDLPVELARECLGSNLRLLNEYHPRHPEHFIKSFYGENATRAVLLDLLLNLPNGTTEIMCHPGYADEALMGSSTYHNQREAELSIFTDVEVLELVKARNIELINFGDL